MNSKLSLARVLYYNTFIAFLISCLFLLFFLVMMLLASVGKLPQTMQATFEVPVQLLNLNELYPLSAQSETFTLSHLEIKNSDLEVLPTDAKGMQVLAYFIAFIYVGLISGILFFLSRIMDNFTNKQAFDKKNARFVRNIGYLTISIVIFKWLIEWNISRYFYQQIDLDNIRVLNSPAIWEINWLALFLGFILLCLSTVFKEGSSLKEFEELTV